MGRSGFTAPGLCVFLGVLLVSCRPALVTPGTSPAPITTRRAPAPTPTPTLPAEPPITPTPRPTSSGLLPISGDWTVNGEQVVENQTITLDGDLAVVAGGSLALRNVTLIVNSTRDGEYGIRVEPQGSMFVYDSVITAADLEHRFSFTVAGDAFVMRDSELHGCGWGGEGEDPSGISEPTATEGWRVAGLFVETDEAVVEGNLMSDNFAAMVLAGTGITVRNNVLESNDYVPISVFGVDSYITGNVIQHAVPSGWGRCIDLRAGHNHTVAGNILSGEGGAGTVSGISIQDSWGNTIVGNTLTGLNGYGIDLAVGPFVSSNNVVANNTISAGEFGIRVHGRNNRVEGNLIEGAETGIDLTYSYNNVIAGNDLSEIGSLHGIRLCHSSNNFIAGNRTSSVESSGIYVWRSSKNNTIQGNTVSSSERGILIFSSSDDNVIGGNVISSTWSGIILDASSGNIIHGNNFINSGERYDSGEDEWDYNGTGNYWSDYGGTDTDRDGIGDEPVGVAPAGVDNHPLMEPAPLETVAVPDLETIPFEESSAFINITGEEVWENQTVVLDTQVTIQDGGQLALRTVTLVLGSESHAGFISVNPGGSLQILQSTVTDTETGYGGRFVAERGSTFVMRDSEWHGVYYSWWNEGFEVYADDAVIADNTIAGVTMMLIHVSGAYVGRNRILDTLCPILLMGSTDSTIENNTISKSLHTAIELAGEYGGGEGTSDHNLIAGNTISDSWGNGIAVYGGDGNVIRENKVSNVYYTAIRVSGSDNLIHRNNLVDNANQAEDSGRNNLWNQGGEGNYWSDYTGTDADGDGIGDTPYVIPTNGVDHHPLMEAH